MASAPGGSGTGGGNGDDDGEGRAGRGTKRTRRAFLDPYLAALEEDDREAGRGPEPDTRADPYAATPEVRALEARPTTPAGPSNARPVPLANSTRPPPSKRNRVDDPVARPRLGEPGFGVEQYVAHYAGSRLDAYRFSLLRRGEGSAPSVQFTASGCTVTVDSRAGAWATRWRHVGNRVHDWRTPDEYDISWFRTNEEREYFDRVRPFLQLITGGQDPINFWTDLDPMAYFPAITALGVFRVAFRWVRDTDFEYRFRHRNELNAGVRGVPDPNVFVGWQNQELFGLAKRDRPGVFALMPDGWVDEVEGERLVGAPSLWTAMYYGSFLTLRDFRTGVNPDNTQPARMRLVTQFRRWMRMEASFLFFARWVHTVIYGVTNRGFSDPGLRTNHGRFEGVLTRLPPAVQAMIERWGVPHLLRGTGLPVHLFQAAVERANAVDWGSLPDNAYTEGGRYFRYAFMTGEVDGLPARRRPVGRNVETRRR